MAGYILIIAICLIIFLLSLSVQTANKYGVREDEEETERKKKKLEEKSKTNNSQGNSRKKYITWFIILILPSILFKLGTYSGNVILSKDLAEILTIMTKIGMIILTIWYALKLKIGDGWALALGFTTLLPFMVWVSALILLAKKTNSHSLPDNKQSKEENKVEIKAVKPENKTINYCPNCGEKISGSHNFCPSCGRNLNL